MYFSAYTLLPDQGFHPTTSSCTHDKTSVLSFEPLFTDQNRPFIVVKWCKPHRPTAYCRSPQNWKVKRVATVNDQDEGVSDTVPMLLSAKLATGERTGLCEWVKRRLRETCYEIVMRIYVLHDSEFRTSYSSQAAIFVLSYPLHTNQVKSKRVIPEEKLRTIEGNECSTKPKSIS